MGTLSGQATHDQFQSPVEMKTFDLFLVPSSSETFDGEAIGRKLAESPWLIQDRSDPTQLVYHNQDNSVRFFVLLDPDLLEKEPAAEHDGYEDEEAAGPTSVLPDAGDLEQANLPGAEEEEEQGSVIDMPTVTINIPLFQPSGVAREAIAFLLSIARSAGLDSIDPQAPGGGEAGSYSAEELYDSWLKTQKSVFLELKGELDFIRWSDERSRNFFGYAASCPELREKYREEGLDVLQVQPASYNGDVLSLCVWRTDVPAVIPLTDLVLLERVRQKRSFFGTRKVTDELLVTGDELWKILAPFAQTIDEPAPMMIFREAEVPPSQVTNDLEELKGEPAAATRTEFNGVIDFDLPAAEPEPESSLE